jgi:Ni/Co efflux regulator RcnB
MKRLFTFVIAGALLTGSAITMAGPQDDHDHGHDKHWSDNDQGDDHQGHNPKDEGRHDNGKHKGWEKQAYRRGDRLPDRYYTTQYYVTDYERYHLRRPDPGYRWIRSDDGQIVLTAIASGIVVDIAINP